jgi:D-xylose transport system substrate-binding protein
VLAPRRAVRPRRIAFVISLLAALVAALVAASVGSGKTTVPKRPSAAPLVALLLPENVTARWEGQDRPRFISDLKKLVPGVQVQVQNALNDPAKQQAQAEAALVKGAKVLVVAAVDQKAAAVIVNNAQKQGVKVVAYDRLIRNSPLSAYVSFDSVAVGRAEAGWVAKHTAKGARIVIINGSPTDDNAHLVNKGMHQVLDPLFKSGAKVKVAEQWVPGWDPSKAQAQMEQILTRFGNRVDGVVSANDGMAGGIIAALKAQGMAGKVPVSGQDATVEGLQRIILGTQGVSVFKDIRLQAKAAAQVAAAYVKGKTPTVFNGKVPNGKVQVPSVLLKVQPIDKTNLTTLIKNGFVTKPVLCKGIPAEGLCSS